MVKKNFIIIIIALLIISICGCRDNIKDEQEEKFVKKEVDESIKQLEDGLLPLLIKPMRSSEATTTIENVEFKLKNEAKLPKEGIIYKVKRLEYSKENFYELAKHLKVKEKFSDIDNDLEIRENGYICKGSNRGLTFNMDNGKIEYIDMLITSPVKSRLSDEYYLKKSDELLNKNKLLNDSMEFNKIEETSFSETKKEDGSVVLEPYIIEVTYLSKPIDGTKNESSIIRVDFNNQGEICGFIHQCRELIPYKTYPFANNNELASEIMKGNILVKGENIYAKNLEVFDYEIILYADISKDNQEYVLPYYKFLTKIKETELSILNRAIKPDHIKELIEEKSAE